MAQPYKLQHKSSKRDIMSQNLSHLALQVFRNNIIGKYIYTCLLILEYLFMGFALLLASERKDSNANSPDIDNLQISIYHLKSNWTFCLVLNSLLVIMNFLSFLGMLKLMFEKKNQPIQKVQAPSAVAKILSIYVAISRTIMNLIYMIGITASLLNLLQSSDDLGGNGYAIIMLIIILCFQILLQNLLVYYIFEISIPQRGIPWSNMNDSKFKLLHEFLKILMIIQDLFISNIQQSQIGVTIYFLFIVFCLGYQATNRSIYFDLFLNKIENFLRIILFNFSIICLFRNCFEMLLLELCIYYPVILIASHLAMSLYEKYKIKKLITNLDTSKEINLSYLNTIINLILQLLENQNFEDQAYLGTILFSHQLVCSNLDCICRDYRELTMKNFGYQEDNIKEREQSQVNSQVQTYQEGDKSPQIDLDVTLQVQSQNPGDNQFSSTNQNITSGVLEEKSSGFLPNILSSSNLNLFVKDLKLSDFFLEYSPDLIIHQSKQSQMEEILTRKYTDQNEFRRVFFIQLLESFAEQHLNKGLIKTAKVDIKNYLLFIHFIDTQLERQFLSIFKLLELNQIKHSISFFDLVTLRTCEQLILQEALAQYVSNASSIDYSQFISNDQDQIRLDKLYEDSSNQIRDFWKTWTLSYAKLSHIIDLGKQIESNLWEIKHIMKTLQENQIAIRDVSRHQLFALFHLELLHDPATFNEMINYIKMALINKQRKGFSPQRQFDNLHFSSKQQVHSQDLAICMVKMHHADPTQLEFFTSNKTFNKIFKTKDDQILGKNIKQIMPKVYSESHDQVVKKFFQRGKAEVLGRKRIMLAKDFEGFIFPVIFQLNFMYHQDYKYAFSAYIEKLKFLNSYQEDQAKFGVDNGIFIITDENYSITDISKNFLAFTEMTQYEFSMLEEVTGQRLSLSNFIIEFDDFIKYEEIGTSIDNLNVANKVIEFQKYDSINLNISKTKSFTCLMNYFQHEFDSLNFTQKVHIFIMIPLIRYQDKNGGKTLMIQTTGVSDAQYKRNRKSSNSEEYKKRESNDKFHQQLASQYLDSDEDRQQDLVSHISSRSSGSSSFNSDILQSQFTRNHLFQNITPRIVKISTILIIVMYSLFISISIYNLVLFLAKYSEIKQRLEVFNLISNRNTYIRAVCMDLKMIHSIGLDLETLNKSAVLPPQYSRIDFYQEDLKHNLDTVRRFSTQFAQFINLNADDFSSVSINFDGLLFLNNQGYTFNETVALSHAINMFINYANSLSAQDIYNYKPPLNVTGYKKTQPVIQKNYALQNQTIRTIHQQLYFLFENGIYKSAEIGIRQENLLIKAAQQQSDDSLLLLKISTFISIGMVSLLCILLFPVFSKILDRQYQVYTFFNRLSDDVVNSCLEQGDHYLSLLKSRMNGQIALSSEHEYENRKPIKQSGNHLNIKKKSSLLERISVHHQKPSKQKLRLEDLISDRKKDETKDELNISQINHNESNEESNSGRDKNSKKDSKKKKINLDIGNLDELNRTKLINSQISKYKLQQKLKILFAIVLLIALLNASLVISYIQSDSIFEIDKEITTDLRTFLRREECALNLVLFMREKIIQNRLLKFKYFYTDEKYTEAPPVYFYVDFCIENEIQVNKLRKDMPQYLKEFEENLNSYESKDLCNKTFEDNDMRQQCYSSLHGALQQGLSSVMNQILQYVQNTNLWFDSVKNRTAQFTTNLLNQKKMQDYPDLIIYFLRHSFDQISTLLMTSVYDFFETAKNNFLLAFGIFITFTSGLVSLATYIIFKRVKKRCIEIQNLLVLIPLEELSQTQKSQIYNYIRK